MKGHFQGGPPFMLDFFSIYIITPPLITPQLI